MSRSPHPNNIKTGFGKVNHTDIYRQPTKEEPGTVTVPSKFFNPSKLPRRRNRPGRHVNYNDMRKYHNLPPIRRLGRRRGSVAKRSATRRSATRRSATRRSATRSATGSVEGGKRTRKYNKKHKKTKKRREKKRRTMRR